ncbi:hypothetical protein [Archangium primigenium]|uniref:hypothetical protein n=1 Tax=[Archangium] primigenium TaxID=2792470 RepID=UPI001956F701|nr:hypothetical protein [Archangium primigenium]MBM7119282.1 hypothetical protein [Archangium primigenium]
MISTTTTEQAPVARQEMPATPVVPAQQVATAPTTNGVPAGQPARAQPQGQAERDDRIWLSESAEAARAGNPNIDPSVATEDITIASATVDGRVKRVGKSTIEVSDNEGNVYELRIDKRSRGLRQGRRVPLQRISEGTPVRASFDLVGAGDSLARDIVLRR